MIKKADYPVWESVFLWVPSLLSSPSVENIHHQRCEVINKIEFRIVADNAMKDVCQ